MLLATLKYVSRVPPQSLVFGDLVWWWLQDSEVTGVVTVVYRDQKEGCIRVWSHVERQPFSRSGCTNVCADFLPRAPCGRRTCSNAGSVQNSDVTQDPAPPSSEGPVCIIICATPSRWPVDGEVTAWCGERFSMPKSSTDIHVHSPCPGFIPAVMWLSLLISERLLE